MTVKEASEAYAAEFLSYDSSVYDTCEDFLKYGFEAGAKWAAENPYWRDFSKEKPKHKQRILALLNGQMPLPCYYRDDGRNDAILHFTDGTVNFGKVNITHWLPLPPEPTQEDTK